MKPTSTGIGFSHQSVPSLSNTATRSSAATNVGALSSQTCSTNATIARRVAVSFQEGSSPTSVSVGERGLELRHRLVDREGRSLLPRREFDERLQELGEQEGARKREVVVVDEPVV